MGGSIGGYLYIQRNDDSVQTASPAHQSSANAVNSAARLTSEVPAELAGGPWSRDGCSNSSAFDQFESGHMIEYNGFSDTAGRFKVKYAKTTDGWQVIRPNETFVFALSDSKLQFKGYEIAGEFISAPNARASERCPQSWSTRIEDDIRAPAKEPLRYALHMAISTEDAAAVRRIIARMPSIEGGVNMEGDPDKQPDIETMLSTATPEIQQIIQEKRGGITTDGSPEEAPDNRTISIASNGLAAAQAAYNRSTNAITVAWQGLPSDRRQQLLPSQRAWIRQKMTDCKNLAAQTTGDADQRETARLQCEVGLDKLRIQQLEAM